MAMPWRNSYNKPVGILGAGSFGTVIANMVAANRPVLLYARKKEAVEEMIATRMNNNSPLHENVTPTNDLEEVANKCDIIFPIVPAGNFRNLIQQIAPYLHPHHILIHGTKGFDLDLPEGKTINDNIPISRDNVKTMSEVILEESVVVRVGCLAGPNLAKEMIAGQPAATVVASRFDEVITEGQKLLRNDKFQVYGSFDLIGVELCGILKNIMAIAAGALNGMGFGENARALLISRGMVEMIYLGKAWGGNTQAFIGLAGIGDLVATSSSKLSRNFTVGYKLAQGEKLQDIINNMNEVAEGVETVRIAKKLADYYKVRAPITEILYKVLYQDMTVEDGLQYLMKYPLSVDVSFL
jgi:glycerol-3-phosphate dehydrogenase (NAD(P)+)